MASAGERRRDGVPFTAKRDGFPSVLREMKIVGVRDIAESVREFSLLPADGKRLDSFTAGAHLECEVRLPDDRMGMRAYSLTNAPDENRVYRIAVARSDTGRGGSTFMHMLHVGGTIRVGSPRNDFPLLLTAPHTLLIAGGIGITPILAMARALSHAGRPFQLHYVGRHRAAMAYIDEIEAMPGASIVFDGGDPAHGLDIPALVADGREGRHLYVCGPRAMIEAVLAAAKSTGWAQRQLHFELFGADLPQAGDRPFTVEFARRGVSAIVPAGRTILDLMEELGLDPLFDCRRGECGICVTDVIEGEPDHRDMNLSEREKKAGNLICTCVSRAKGDRLVLDI